MPPPTITISSSLSSSSSSSLSSSSSSKTAVNEISETTGEIKVREEKEMEREKEEDEEEHSSPLPFDTLIEEYKSSNLPLIDSYNKLGPSMTWRGQTKPCSLKRNEGWSKDELQTIYRYYRNGEEPNAKWSKYQLYKHLGIYA